MIDLAAMTGINVVQYMLVVPELAACIAGLLWQFECACLLHGSHASSQVSACMQAKESRSAQSLLGGKHAHHTGWGACLHTSPLQGACSCELAITATAARRRLCVREMLIDADGSCTRCTGVEQQAGVQQHTGCWQVVPHLTGNGS